MRIAVVSDSHSDWTNIARALERLRGSDVEQVFHCGDIDSPAAAELFADFSTTFVLGNTDGNHHAIRNAIEQSGNHCAGRTCDTELDGQRIFMLHGDDQRAMLKAKQSGDYALILHGHTHVAEQYRVGPTLVVNPGALHRARIKTIALIDLATLDCTHVPISPAE